MKLRSAASVGSNINKGNGESSSSTSIDCEESSVTEMSEDV